MYEPSSNANALGVESDLVSPAQAAQFLRVAKNTVYHWIRMGYFPHYRAGKLIRIRFQDLQTFLKHEAA